MCEIMPVSVCDTGIFAGGNLVRANFCAAGKFCAKMRRLSCLTFRYDTYLRCRGKRKTFSAAVLF
ncbi:hypothetical protein BRYFOR_06881 [Marvinbryantia formatexigens DSM 14469]|uniref:Uncharacterized protein n=1 Tax=Marvinbryantia formatexigens DSM 14469 TaxID=478749 RepID=C6LE32_9FIRM|nr:hypothetical protein BRYFOR_06881 [Marvinbryantia formatexigens DSM 14469]